MVAAIVSPATYDLPLTGPLPDRAPGDRGGPRYRSPRALVLRDGRILVLLGRREYPARGGRGIVGVVSDDLGETWSEEFVLRGDAYSFDLGYPVVTELADGRLFTAYWFTSKDGRRAGAREPASALHRRHLLPAGLVPTAPIIPAHLSLGEGSEAVGWGEPGCFCAES